MTIQCWKSIYPSGKRIQLRRFWIEDWEKTTKLRDVAWLIRYRTFKGEARDPLWTIPFLNIQSWFKRVIILVMTSNCWSFQRERIKDMNHSLKELKLLHSALMERAPHSSFYYFPYYYNSFDLDLKNWRKLNGTNNHIIFKIKYITHLTFGWSEGITLYY